MCFFTGPGKAVIANLSAGPCIWIELCYPGGYLTLAMKHMPGWFPHYSPKLLWWVLCDSEAQATPFSYLIHFITIQLGPHNSLFLNQLLNLLLLNFFTCFTVSTLILQVSPELYPRSLSHPGGYWMVIKPGPPHVTHCNNLMNIE